MESGSIAANSVPIIKSDLCVFQPFCVTGRISRTESDRQYRDPKWLDFYCWCEKRNGWDGQETQIQMKFRREMHLEKKTVVVSMADRATKRVQQ